MKRYAFLANKAKEFAESYFHDACDLIVGRKRKVLIARYLVYPTYFKWLLNASREKDSGQDKLYVTHTGLLEDFREGSAMWNYITTQKSIAFDGKLEVTRIVVLTNEEKDLDKEYMAKRLRHIGGKNITVRLSTTKLLYNYIQKPKELNYAIYERDKKFFLLKYVSNIVGRDKELKTMITIAQEVINPIKADFDLIVKNLDKSTSFLVDCSSIQTVIDAIDAALNACDWNK